MATPGIYTETPFSATRRNMDVNFYGQAEMSYAVLRDWLAPEAPIEEQPKHFIFTTSVVIFFTIAGYGPYSPSKWAVRGLADTLSQEVMLYPQKVKIHMAVPGTILSPGLERENSTKPDITHIIEKDDPRMMPDEVGKKLIQGLENGDYFVTVAFLGNLMKWGCLGGSFRNNWVVDFFMAWFVQIVWLFALPDILGKIRKFGKEFGHPSTYGKKVAEA
jgi:3-dehydrosphinganine reductase